MVTETEQRRLSLLEQGRQFAPELFEALTPAQTTAVELVAAIHAGMDWDTWGGPRYWGQLTERVKLARIAGNDLKDWWQNITSRMGVTLPSRVARVEAMRIVAGNDPNVLRALTDDAEFVVELVRVCVSAKQEARAETIEGPLEGQEAMF